MLCMFVSTLFFFACACGKVKFVSTQRLPVLRFSYFSLYVVAKSRTKRKKRKKEKGKESALKTFVHSFYTLQSLYATRCGTWYTNFVRMCTTLKRTWYRPIFKYTERFRITFCASVNVVSLPSTYSPRFGSRMNAIENASNWSTFPASYEKVVPRIALLSEVMQGVWIIFYTRNIFTCFLFPFIFSPSKRIFPIQ